MQSIMPESESALGILDRVLKPLTGIWRSLRGRAVGRLHLVPHQVWCTWSSGSQGGKEGTILRARFHATNTGIDPISLVEARLTRPAVDGVVLVRDPDSDDWGSGSLPSRELMSAEASFFTFPPIHAPGANLVADVVIVDNLARAHRRRVVFNPY